MVFVRGELHDETFHPSSNTDIDEKAPETRSERFLNTDWMVLSGTTPSNLESNSE